MAMTGWGVGWNMESLRAQIREMQAQELMASVTSMVLDAGFGIVMSYWAMCRYDDVDLMRLEVDHCRWDDDGGRQP